MTRGVYPRPTLAERFEAMVDRSAGADGCHPWLGGRHEKGYGRFHRDGRRVQATHVALELDGRPVSPGMEARHTCDNPPCVNARHLIEGTTADNIGDKVARGRQATGDRNGARLRPETRPRGEDDGLARLTEADVREIRLLAVVYRQRALAEKFGVSKTTIGDILRGRTWQHVR